MPANVETMFCVREAPWHGLGVRVESALNSKGALVMPDLNRNVIQKPIMITSGNLIPGCKANIRDTGSRVPGVVTDRYRVVQNSEAFAFTDALLGEDVRYETAGSLQDGRRIWILAKFQYFNDTTARLGLQTGQHQLLPVLHALPMGMLFCGHWNSID